MADVLTYIAGLRADTPSDLGKYELLICFWLPGAADDTACLGSCAVQRLQAVGVPAARVFRDTHGNAHPVGG